MFEEAFQRGLDEERREKERARKLARARESREEDDARDKKVKWPCVTQ